MSDQIKSCLLVEDDPEDQEFFMNTLHEISSDVGCFAVSNGEDALFALLNDNFQPDYIFTDLRMPRMDGFEFLKLLRGLEKFKTIPVIVYSSDISENNIRQLKALDVAACYLKTTDRDLKQILAKYFINYSPTLL